VHRPADGKYGLFAQSLSYRGPTNLERESKIRMDDGNREFARLARVRSNELTMPASIIAIRVLYSRHSRLVALELGAFARRAGLEFDYGLASTVQSRPVAGPIALKGNRDDS